MIISVLSWTSVLDYIKSLKKSSSDDEKKSLGNKTEDTGYKAERLWNGSLHHYPLLNTKPSVARPQSDKPLYDRRNEIQLTTANLDETLI